MIQLRHAAVGVKELAQARAFFEGVLGFQPYHVSDQDWVMLESRGTSLSLIVTQGVHPDHLGVVVDRKEQVDELRQKIQASPHARQVSEAKVHRDGSYGFYFKDADLNQFECIFIPHIPSTVDLSTQGLVVLGHGSHDPRWAQPLRDLCERISRNAKGLAVRLAFMEMCKPTLSEAVSDLVQESPRKLIRIVPAFISSGAHVSQDVPRLVDQIRVEHPNLKIILEPALGESEGVLEAMALASLSHVRHRS